MANPFVKAWKYLMAAFSAKVDENADPKVQIQQAIEEAQRNHQQLSQQAASVIGNQRQLEMKLNRQLGEVEKLQSSTRQALTLAEEARERGDEQKAQEYETAAEGFAAQLITAEQSIEDLKTLHDQALQAADQAKEAVERNASMLQQKLAERTKLMSQLEQAKMQEQVSSSLNQMTELSGSDNTPSLEDVRDKIEKRYTTAVGSAELAQNSVQGRMMEVQHSTTQLAGHNRLEQIRASMGGGSVAGEVAGGAASGTSSAGTSSAGATQSAASGSDVQNEIQQRVQAEQQKNQA
ncbi:PspA/IM30 family protein [Prauserella halophila]|nr:PspA/IM30 family protein [Prauserella halophila]MCP2234391.1 phage shock protein A (PspA) family protein [Prauserella halophila]